jgi:hypothetical protein
VQSVGGSALAIFDIDGVLADVRHRLHYLETTPEDWDAFFAAAAADPALTHGVSLAHDYAARSELLYLTGRPERTRQLTGNWLARQGLPPGKLLMRPDHDRRPAALFKREQARALGRTREIEVLIDDDPAVVDLLTAAGIPVRLADWLPYTRVLRQAQERDGRS